MPPGERARIGSELSDLFWAVLCRAVHSELVYRDFKLEIDFMASSQRLRQALSPINACRAKPAPKSIFGVIGRDEHEQSAS